MSAAIDELINRRAMMLSRRECLVAELKTLDTDMAAVMHVISMLDPAGAGMETGSRVVSASFASEPPQGSSQGLPRKPTVAREK